MEYFENLDPLLRAFWFVAIPSSLIFVIQTAMTFLGLDASDGMEADFDGDMSGGDAPFQLFSLRNLINFLLGFGWTGVSFYSTISSKPLLIALAFVVGALFVLMFFFIIRQLLKLAEDNSFRFENTVNKNAEVYLTIPGQKNGKGKVIVSVNGSVHELDAITEGDSLPSGTMVKVVRLEDNQLLIVEKL